jgi:heme A synthase
MKLSKFALYAWGVLIWNLLTIQWGAYVRASGSGAGCGRHWPLCNGEILPQAPDVHMRIEFTHRLLSGGALVLIALLIVWGWRAYAKGHPARKGLVASGILIATEALLGAGLVLLELVAENQSLLRALAVALHLANTFLLIGSLALTAYWASGGRDLRLKGSPKTTWLLSLGLLGVLVVGMSGAITALGDTLFPPGSLAEGFQQDFSASAHFLLRLRVYHPLIAVTVAVYTLYLLQYLYGKYQGLPQRMFLILGALILIQLGAGLTNLLLLAPIPMQLIHLFMADMVWIGYLLTTAAVLAVVPIPS